MATREQLGTMNAAWLLFRCNRVLGQIAIEDVS
jgi:hypothetical protein